VTPELVPEISLMEDELEYMTACDNLLVARRGRGCEVMLKVKYF
jgi:hypothetical protein